MDDKNKPTLLNEHVDKDIPELLSVVPVDKNNTIINNEVIRVSINDGARLFGVSAQTLRRAIKDGEVTYIIVAGRYKINFESLVKWSQSRTTLRNKSANIGIGQFVHQWKINNKLYSPRPPKPIRQKKQRS